jgi:hypothetical protein
MKGSSQLDAADQWLLENDPLLSKTTAKALGSRRLRQTHRQGKVLLDEITEYVAESAMLEPDAPDTERLVRLAPRSIRPLIALRMRFPGASQAELARMLGCTRQAVSKKRPKLIAYLQAMADPPPPPTSSSVGATPVFMRPDGQLAWDFSEDE